MDETERLTWTIPEVAQKLGLSRNCAYEAAQRGEIPTIKVGRRLLVSKMQLQQMLEQGSKAVAR